MARTSSSALALSAQALDAKDGAQHVSADGSYRTAATTRGSVNSTVSSQWASRPDDQRFANLNDLLAFKRREMEMSYREEIDAREIRVQAAADRPNDLGLILPNGDLVEASHFAFGQLCSTIRASAGYLRQLPARVAAVPLQYSLMAYDGRLGNEVAAYMRRSDDEDGKAQLRAVTSTSYGRIFDAHVVEELVKFAGDGVGETRWKVPGMIDWGSGDGETVRYNPNVNITKDNTSLFGSDRDTFAFLVDDRNPIEIGKLPSGAPDLVFRGFWVRNSEVGAYEYEVAAMYLRGVCCNRNLWGVEGFQSLSIRHTKGAPERFLTENAPMLENFAEASQNSILSAVQVAKARTIGKTEEAAIEWLVKHGATKKQATESARLVQLEEQTEMRTVWDAVTGLTAHARSIYHNDKRLEVESLAGTIFDNVTS